MPQRYERGGRNRTAKRDTWGQKRQRPRATEEWVRLDVPELRIVSDELWAAVHARLSRVREAYVGATGGRLWGRPAQRESKYLLPGLVVCGTCGSGYHVRTRSHGWRRAAFYGCSGYHLRGRSVCPNNVDVPMAAADELLLGALEDDALHPGVVEHALAEALAILRAETGQPRAARGEELDQVTAELARLADAVRLGRGAIPALVAAMEPLEARRAALVQEQKVAALGTVVPATQLAALAPAMRERLSEWRDMLRTHVGSARRVLRELLLKRAVLTLSNGPDGRFAELTAQLSLGRVFSGLLCPKQLVAPTGFEPVFQP